MCQLTAAFFEQQMKEKKILQMCFVLLLSMTSIDPRFNKTLDLVEYRV